MTTDSGSFPAETGPRWDDLIGVRVSVGGRGGVVLPPPAPPHPQVLRLALLDGSVIPFEPDGVEVSPMPADTFKPPKGSKRRVRLNGLPIYRSGEIPDGVLATMTMLKHLRRQLPPPDEEPGVDKVACFLAGNEYYPLYPVVDCPPMVEQSPARRAAWVTARTCAWCSASRPHPWPKSPSNGHMRLCHACAHSSREQLNLAANNVRRMFAEEHVRAILADPATVIVCGHTTSRERAPRNPGARNLGVTGSDTRNVVIVDNAGHIIGEYDYTRSWDDGISVAADEATTADLTRLRDSLIGKRAFGPGHDDVRDIRSDLWDIDRTSEFRDGWGGWDGPGINSRLGGNYLWILSDAGLRWPPKMTYPDGASNDDRERAKAEHIYRTVMGTEPPTSTALLHWQILNMIATGPHPDGTARCPFRATHTQPACESTELSPDGFCHDHRGIRTASATMGGTR